MGTGHDTDTYGQGLHMNFSGAEKSAEYLGKFFLENYMLKSMRDKMRL